MDEYQDPAQSTMRQYSPENEATITKPQDYQAEPDLDEGPRECTPTIPSSLAPSSLPRPSSPISQNGEQLLSSQPSELPWNDDELSSPESLPDALKELQDMFSGTYESYPPDFPMSLR